MVKKSLKRFFYVSNTENKSKMMAISVQYTNNIPIVTVNMSGLNNQKAEAIRLHKN